MARKYRLIVVISHADSSHPTWQKHNLIITNEFYASTFPSYLAMKSGYIQATMKVNNYIRTQLLVMVRRLLKPDTARRMRHEHIS